MARTAALLWRVMACATRRMIHMQMLCCVYAGYECQNEANYAAVEYISISAECVRVCVKV